MKKSIRILLPISTMLSIPILAAQCSHKEEDKLNSILDDNMPPKKQKNDRKNEPINDIEVAKKNLEKEINDYIKRKGAYSDDFDTKAFYEANSAIDKASVALQDKKATVESINKALEELKEARKKTDAYFNLKREQKQDLLKDEFTKTIEKGVQKEKQLSKISAKKVILEAIEKAKSISEKDTRYYRKIKAEILLLEQSYQEAEKLEKMSNKQLFELYLHSENKIVNRVQTEYGLDEFYINIQEEIKEKFKEYNQKFNDEVKGSNSEQKYEEYEKQLRKNVDEIFKKLDVSLTPSRINKLFDKDVSSITIPKEIEYINSHSFEGFNNLNTVKFGSKIKKIDYKAFAKTKIKQVELPQSLIYLSGFDETLVETLTLPKELINVHDAFNNVKTLHSLTLNAKLKNLSGFNNSGIKSIELHEGLETFDGFRRSKITSIKLPKSLTKFITELEELTEITFADGFDFEKATISTDRSAKRGIVIDTSLFPKLNSIYVENEEARKKLLAKFGAKDTKNTDEKEIVRAAEYYIEYLFFLSQKRVKDKYRTFSTEIMNKLKEIVVEELKTYPNDIENAIDAFIHKQKYNSAHSLDQTKAKISNLTKLLTSAGFEITQERIAQDTQLEDKDNIKTEFNLEKDKYEKALKTAQGDKWAQIIKVKTVKNSSN
ncbi:leucine-rich repeat domain-containing protein [Mycoplasmopsis mucosicanis]|uniref:Leucine-rich repeat domain-containing protein n=1 Tax=Mycoplasmopsis mucosicanis TaxID=458208 RepID=A0A507SR50_9BACT|nr:leucine-rich repeat domain-containing protein [Mycoplasmopsis mucosicanis]TQC51623.1 leucine-rich repeat domain-containing protein [Mycoplasmopsis mucosicanis]